MIKLGCLGAELCNNGQNKQFSESTVASFFPSPQLIFFPRQSGEIDEKEIKSLTKRRKYEHSRSNRRKAKIECQSVSKELAVIY